MTVCPYCGEEGIESRMPGLVLDKPVVAYNGMAVDLSAQQFMIIEALAHKWPNLCTKEHMMLWVWHTTEEPETSSNAAAVQLVYVRRALFLIGLAIETVWAVGYKLRTVEELGDDYVKRYALHKSYTGAFPSSGRKVPKPYKALT